LGQHFSSSISNIVNYQKVCEDLGGVWQGLAKSGKPFLFLFEGSINRWPRVQTHSVRKPTVAAILQILSSRKTMLLLGWNPTAA